MKREIIITADGSKTISLPEWNEQYHSKHGAIQEAYHVFIKAGLSLFKNQDLSILEIGFGTGLNALISLLEYKTQNLKVTYHGIEGYSVALSEIKALNYSEFLNISEAVFLKLHTSNWEEFIQIEEGFRLKKENMFFANLSYKNCFDLVYFDAFGPRVQPDLWTETIFKNMYKALKTGGVLVTYSAKGSVRRAMQSVGFSVERLPGPPGKREMLRATK